LVYQRILLETESPFTAVEYLPYKGLIAATEDGTIFHVNPATKEVIKKFDCQSPVQSFLLTGLHVAAFTGDALHFFEVSDENETVRFVQDLPAKVFVFEQSVEKVFYVQSMLYMVAVATDGGLLKLPIKAEMRVDTEMLDDDPDAVRGAKKTVNIRADPQPIGMFHNSKVILCDETKENHKLVSASENGLLTIHDLNKGTMLSHLKFKAKFTCGTLNSSGNMVILGSDAGCLRIIDIANPQSPRLVLCRKLHNSDSIRSVRVSGDQALIAFITENSNRVYLLSGSAETNFELYGFSVLPGSVLDMDWTTTAKPPIDPKKSKQVLEIIVKNGLIVALSPLRALTPGLTFKELSPDDVSLRGRRVDFDVSLAAIDPDTADIFTTGEEKVIRRYKQPEDHVRDMDMRPRAPFTPIEEIDGHELTTNFIRFKEGAGAFVSGGLDGSVIRRTTKNPATDLVKVQTQNHVHSGVSSCSCSETYPIIISGGFDGSLLVHSFKPFSFGDEKIQLGSLPKVADCAKFDSVRVESDSDVKYYETILEEENRKAREDEKYHTQKNMKERLMAIGNELKRLLLKNKDAQDLEKIERDEFCLDLELRQKLLTEGEKEVESIKKDADHKNLKEEIFHKKMMMLTYSKIDTHLKTLTGLKENTLVTNFVIRKKEKHEVERYKLASNMRAVELTEKQWRKDNKLYDTADLFGIFCTPEQYKEKRNEKRDELLEDFLQEYHDAKQIISKPENFICNLKVGKQKYLLLDHAKREDERQKTIAAALEFDKGADLKDAHMEAPDRPDPTGYRLHRLSRNPKNKRKAAGVQSKGDDNQEDEKEDVIDNEADKDEEGQRDWDQMYGAFELFTTKRKKSQCLFLKNMIFKVKRAFNREFELFVKIRNSEIDKINELNFLIQEQMAKLNEISTPFVAIPNIIEK
jgi:hypothetical protein